VWVRLVHSDAPLLQQACGTCGSWCSVASARVMKSRTRVGRLDRDVEALLAIARGSREIAPPTHCDGACASTAAR
jgi:hypothetical protein